MHFSTYKQSGTSRQVLGDRSQVATPYGAQCNISEWLVQLSDQIVFGSFGSGANSSGVEPTGRQLTVTNRISL